MRTSRTFALALLPISAAGLFLSRPGADIRAQAAPTKGTDFVTYASGISQYTSAPHTLEMSHGVQFGQDDATLKTDAALVLFDKDQNVISATTQAPVHLFDPQDDLVGQHGTVNFTKHLATLRDSIVLVVKPGKREANASSTSVRKQFKDPATLTCQLMTYDYRNKVGRIPGPLTVTQVIQTKDGQQTRTLTAEAGLYNGVAETIQLVGNIKGTYSDGSVIEGNAQPGKPVLINIKEGSEAIFVPFPTQGHFTVKAQSGTSKDDTDKDDGPDLSLPTVPAHASDPVAASAPPAAPPALAAPAVQATPAQTAPAQTPQVAAPAGSP